MEINYNVIKSKQYIVINLAFPNLANMCFTLPALLCELHRSCALKCSEPETYVINYRRVPQHSPILACLMAPAKKLSVLGSSPVHCAEEAIIKVFRGLNRYKSTYNVSQWIFKTNHIKRTDLKLPTIEWHWSTNLTVNYSQYNKALKTKNDVSMVVFS